MHTATHIATTTALQLLQQAMAIANRAVISDIETEGVRVDLGDGQRWYDTRPMLDPRERCPDSIEMATQALDYAEKSGLVHRHADQRFLLRLPAAE